MAKKKGKSKAVKGLATAKVDDVKPKAPKPQEPDPWVWLEGLHSFGFWMPLYSFPRADMARARGTLKYILRLDTLPPELTDYDDFRVNPGDLERMDPDSDPEEVAEARAAYARWDAERVLKGSQRAQKLSGHALEPAPVPEPAEMPTEPEIKKRKRCKEVYDANRKLRCLLEPKHKGELHRDRKGHRWE